LVANFGTKVSLTVAILSEARDLNRSVTDKRRKEFSREGASSPRGKKTQDETSCKSRSRNSMSGVRARQRYTGACRPKLLRFISRHCSGSDPVGAILGNKPVARSCPFAKEGPRRCNLFCFQKN